MEKIYEILIVKRLKTLDQVPEKIREAVRNLLIADGYMKQE